MARSQRKSKLTNTGSRINAYRKKKLNELGREAVLTKLSPRKITKIRVLGGNFKPRLHSDENINVYNPKTKKTQKTKIASVDENKANRHYVRRNILTKGAIISTEFGKVKITSRPGQDGCINGVLQE